MRYLLCILVFAGCGNLQPDTPDSKLNSNPNATPNNSNPNANPNATPNNVVVDTGEWGTAGPATRTGQSPDGFALCVLSDVVTDDLGDVNDTTVAPDPWSSSPVPDVAARCGDDLETLVWRLHNCERIGAGLQPFQCDERLVWMGREHTQDMITQDYFHHNNPAGERPQDRMDRHGVGWSGAAENIARGTDALSLHYRWMDSTGHRGNILGSYTHVGLGIEPNGDFLATVVFLTPR